jgi:hypothetical protein
MYNEIHHPVTAQTEHDLCEIMAYREETRFIFTTTICCNNPMVKHSGASWQQTCNPTRCQTMPQASRSRRLTKAQLWHQVCST